MGKLLIWGLMGLMLGVGWLLTRGKMMRGTWSREEVIGIVESYLAGSISRDRWQHFLRYEATDAKVEAARKRCLDLVTSLEGQSSVHSRAPDAISGEMQDVLRLLRNEST